MKKIILAAAFLIGSIASAAAACVSPAVMHDFPGTSFNMSLATVPDGNCGSNIAVPTWAGGTLGAMANYGTSPGAVLVPGVNAFVTNTPPVSQSGTWTVQPGNTANTTAWLMNVGAINGVTPLMGNGATGTGSQRVTLSNDNTIPTGWPTAALQTSGNASLTTIATNSALPLPAQTGIGNVNIGAVQSAGSQYETVAASQTAQALGATGATGDYLSHCVIYPVTTGAGAVTVFDNTNAAATNVINFTSGTLSNLAPIPIPVGAISTAGAWKVTTGTNVTVTCYGKFT